MVVADKNHTSTVHNNNSRGAEYISRVRCKLLYEHSQYMHCPIGQKFSYNIYRGTLRAVLNRANCFVSTKFRTYRLGMHQEFPIRFEVALYGTNVNVTHSSAFTILCFPSIYFTSPGSYFFTPPMSSMHQVIGSQLCTCCAPTDLRKLAYVFSSIPWVCFLHHMVRCPQLSGFVLQQTMSWDGVLGWPSLLVQARLRYGLLFRPFSISQV
jgi:hypothetical protein